MKVAIMQPYFLPYIGYFSLIKATDKFILFDTPQYIYHGWLERNRILKPSGGWNYIGVSLQKHSHDCAISELKINNQEPWKEKILAQLVHYKKAPFYYKTIQLLKDIFSEEFEDLVSLNYSSVVKICEYLGIHREISVYSRMGLTTEKSNAPDEWALNICKALKNADEYINPIGGIDFFDTEKYTRERIKIKFQKMILDPYKQFGVDFEVGLSIIDVLMFCTKNEVNDMLEHFEFV